MHPPAVIEPDIITPLQRIVRALEQRFANHNGPFEYGTRLAEETGELIEAAYATKDGYATKEQQTHLLKEMQDVLRVTVGITSLYHLTDALPTTLRQLADATTDTHGILTYIVRLGIASGELASTINHAEGTGVKRQKHGDDAASRVLESATRVASIVAQMAQHLQLEAAFERDIAATDIRYQAGL